MQTVGESVKKFYADIMHDLRHPELDENVMSDFPVDQDINDDVHKKKIVGPKERTPKAGIKRLSKNLRIYDDTDNDVTCASSYEKSCDTDVLLTSAPSSSFKVNMFNSNARQRVRSTNIRSKLAPTMMVNGNTSTETKVETCRTLSSNVINENREVPFRPAAAISNQSLAEVKKSDVVLDCCSGNESSEKFPDLPVFDNEPDDEKEMNVSYSSSAVQSGEQNGEYSCICFLIFALFSLLINFLYVVGCLILAADVICCIFCYEKRVTVCMLFLQHCHSIST